MEGDLTWGGEHAIQCTDDESWNCTPETEAGDSREGGNSGGAPGLR